MKGLIVLHINVRSLLPKIDSIRNDFKGSNIDVLCITESWLHWEIPDNLVSIAGYQLYRNDRTYSRGGGTCIFVSKRIYTEVGVVSLNNKDIEIQVIRITGNTVNTRCKNILIFNIYRPPSGNSTRGREQIISICGSLSDIWSSEIIIVGDLNWNYAKRESADYKHIVEIENVLTLEQVIKCPTRINIHTESIIDLIFSNITNLFKSGCVEYFISDHFPTYIIKKREIVKVENNRM